ncbi:hypothetical protein ACFOWB_19760 [Chenggangzhangella methanolivorans]
MDDLALVSFCVDDKQLPIGNDDRDIYQPTIAELMSTGSFFDVLIVLRFLVFVFEDRRSLVWDESAQRQIFRATLSTTPAEAQRTLSLQRIIVEADSSARNTRVQVNKARHALDEAVRTLQSRDENQAALYVSEQTTLATSDRRDELRRMLEACEDEQLQERRSRMRAEHERDQLLNELDGAKLRLITQLFADIPPVAKLALGRIVEQTKCACCGQDAPQLAEKIQNAITHNSCPYCEQPIPSPTATNNIEHIDRSRIDIITKNYKVAAEQAEASANRLSEIELDIQANIRELQLAERELNSILSKQLALRRNLALESDDVTRRRIAVETLSELMNEALDKQRFAEQDLRSLVETLEETVRDQQDAIANLFAKFSNAFMRETCHLTYIGQDERIGQEGARFRFPSFQVALSGGAVAGETLRSAPEAVSLSQREYIDIAFRMSVLNILSESAGACLIVDTPEAGLDFLFAERAGEQFRLFAPENGSANRVVVTSNLVNDNLLNSLLAGVPKGNARKERIMNLVQYAAPTAAVTMDADRYQSFIKKIIDGQDQEVDGTDAHR